MILKNNKFIIDDKNIETKVENNLLTLKSILVYIINRFDKN